jgi:hypothetical protein
MLKILPRRPIGDVPSFGTERVPASDKSQSGVGPRRRINSEDCISNYSHRRPRGSLNRMCLRPQTDGCIPRYRSGRERNGRWWVEKILLESIQLKWCSIRGASLQAMVKLYEFELILLLSNRQEARTAKKSRPGDGPWTL